MDAEPRIILIAGASRSRSTWLYNIVRLMMTKVDPNTYGCWIQEYNPPSQSRTHVVKIHDMDDLHHLNAKPEWILTSRRPLRETMVSLKRMGWGHDFRGQLEKMLKQDAYWFPKSYYCLYFDESEFNELSEVTDVAGALGLSLTKDEVLNVVELESQIKDPEPSQITSKYDHDMVTLRHPKHRKTIQEVVQLEPFEEEILQEFQEKWPKRNSTQLD